MNTGGSKTFLSEVLIELHVPDFQPALDFYSLLGFRLKWLEADYMVLKREQQALCFYGGSKKIEHHEYFGSFPRDTKRGFGVELILFFDEIEKLYAALCSKVKVVSELQLRHWGQRDFRVEDPFGYYLRLSERYDTVERLDKSDATREWAGKLRLRLPR